jgi:uncharacterized protein
MSKKEIAKIKLTLTTNCNSNCNYCFVKKTNERMSLAVAEKSVDLLLVSSGKEKLLSLYGGEPFLEFLLIEKIVIYARKKEEKFKKNLIISICSNLLLLDEKKVNFLKKYRVKVTVSLVGESRDHNKFRNAKGKQSSHARVLKNLKYLAMVLPKEDIGISFVVLPELSSKMVAYFLYIVALNLSKNINFEIIQEFGKWREIDYENFVHGFRKILLLITKEISENNFIFINPISWELGRKKLTEKFRVPCPVRYNLEVYPSGDIAFSPFLLNVEDEKKNQFLIGKVEKGLNAKFKNCNFDPISKQCRNCENDYYGNYVRNDGAAPVVKAYIKMSLVMAEEFERLAKKNKYFQNYIVYAKKNLCF